MLERLARGHEARITVTTPNRRLAQSLASEFAAAQLARGLKAWETADILPFDALVKRLWEDALYSDLAAGVPLPLSAAQEQALWEEAIHATRYAQTLFSAAPAAVQCAGAWQLAHAWRLSLKSIDAPGEDTRAFLDWSSRYERATRDRHQTDFARLPDVVAPHLRHAALRKPAMLVLFGMDIVTPQTGDFIGALARQGCEIVEVTPPTRNADVKRVQLADAKVEIETAARWARSRLEKSGAARIGVVVPDLAKSRSRVQRIFANVMRPDHLVATGPAPLPFNISLGAALDEYPMIFDALTAIGLAGAQAPFESASRVIRSPFFGGAESEMQARARFDAAIRERCGSTVTLDSLARLAGSPKMPRAPVLAERLDRLAQFRRSDLFGSKPASEWAKAFSEALRLLGFPGERALDSAEHQTLDRWHELLAGFATLERVSGKMGFNAARERLRGMARDEIFQPEARDVPIQVMGILESAGQEFDHLWVMGLTDEAWPLAARPDPFIPVHAQRAAGIPQSDPVSSLELDRRITQGWLTCADEVVVSHPRMKAESELAPSPLIASIAASRVEELAIASFPALRQAMRAASVIETLDDSRAPPIGVATQRGGTGLFKDQAACPFRAFAHRRLDSQPLEEPRPGLSLRDRGTLVHEMMKLVWKSLGTRERLAAAGETLGPILEACADQALTSVKRYRSDVLSARYARLERARLIRLARDWLELDAGRGDFDVVAVMGERPDEPQLPMYALGRGEDVAAVAFAVVRTGESRYRGIARAAKLIPGVGTIDKDQSKAARRYRDWGELVAGWRIELEAIGRGFAAGDARVDPKRGPETCGTCDQQMFCRVAEKAPFGVAGDNEGDGDE